MARTLDVPTRGATEEKDDRRKWLVLVAMVFGLFMPMLDNLVVNVALPTIRLDLDSGISGLQWIIDAYTLTFASFMLTGGALGDLYGRKRFFMAGLVVFVLGSLACAVSGSLEQLIAFRAVQGLGAAMLLPGSLSIITATFTGKERGAAIGIWGAMSGLAIAVGPVVGGYLVEHVSWESIFFINVPVGLLGLALTWFVVRESRDERKTRRLDPAGLVTGTAAVFFLTFALIEGNSRGWTDPVILGSFGLSAAFLIAFFVAESRHYSPMLPLSFFRIPTFAASNVVAAAVFFALFGSTFFLALYLQNVQGYSPVGAGTRLLPFTAMILLIAPVAGRLSDRFGSRWFMTAGTFTLGVGLLLVLFSQPGSSYAGVILPSMVVMGAGMAMTMAPMTAAVMASVSPNRAGVASAATNTSREMGGVFGIALLGALVTSAFNRGFPSRLVEAGFPADVAERIALNAGEGSAAGGITVETVLQQAPAGTTVQQAQAVVDAGKEAFVHAMHVGIVVAAAFAFLAAIVSFIWVRSHVGAGEEGAGYAH
ncbi:MAG: MFS transporter [Actinobacteria bacterium]|nr:MFS transporter [Actinomycetota bacterium]